MIKKLNAYRSPVRAAFVTVLFTNSVLQSQLSKSVHHRWRIEKVSLTWQTYPDVHTIGVLLIPHMLDSPI